MFYQCLQIGNKKKKTKNKKHITKNLWLYSVVPLIMLKPSESPSRYVCIELLALNLFVVWNQRRGGRGKYYRTCLGFFFLLKKRKTLESRWSFTDQRLRLTNPGEYEPFFFWDEIIIIDSYLHGSAQVVTEWLLLRSVFLYMCGFILFLVMLLSHVFFLSLSFSFLENYDIKPETKIYV